MAENLLQTIKLEISKNFKLLPYEKIAFHKILGILKSANGMQVLLKELNMDPLVRQSAIETLCEFRNQEVMQTFTSILMENITEQEKTYILNYIERYGSGENIEEIKLFIERNKIKDESSPILAKAFNVLRIIGAGSRELFKYFSDIATNTELDPSYRTYSIIGLSSFVNVPIFESLLKEQNEIINYATFKSIGIFSANQMKKIEAKSTDESEEPFYEPGEEDRAILEIRVLLGKMTTHFDSYDNRTKVAFINAMISSNHREFVIYTMRALTSENQELIKMMLYLIRSNASKLRDPDKFFRNLIALSVNSENENEVIVDIFQRYFESRPDNRKSTLMRDRLFNYIVVTLESFFETFRKEFMVSDVVEKSFPENFRKIRDFVLEKFSPELKRSIVHYLKNADNSTINNILIKISQSIYYLDSIYTEDLTNLLEVLIDVDVKTRENSANRIDSINFEKRYLRDRINRLCQIISRLKIDNAANTLVKIFNYIKKYPEPEISMAVSRTLSDLNYSYMLGELEVILASGIEQEQERVLKYLSQFKEQRAINIILDFIKEHLEKDSPLVVSVLQILLNRDILGNSGANNILKELVSRNTNKEIKRLGIQCIGKCGNESDIDYLKTLFHSLKPDDPKEAVIQAIGFIITVSSNFNKRQTIRYLQEYLKDPSIKVRIYSCTILIKLGNKSALKTIQDMMIIKNKGIQREILSIVGNVRSLEFSYFLISLLQEEYAISNDIIPILKLLPLDEITEIDQFIINIFKKHESPDIEASQAAKIAGNISSDSLKNLKRINTTVLNIEILNYRTIINKLNYSEMTILLNQINNAAISEIVKNQGNISRIIGGEIHATFEDPIKTATSAMQIIQNLNEMNKTFSYSDKINLSISILTDSVKEMEGELIGYDKYLVQFMNSANLENKIIIDDKTFELFKETLFCERLPLIIFPGNVSNVNFYEIIEPINFLKISNEILQLIKERNEKRESIHENLDDEIKKQRERENSAGAIEVSKIFNEIGKILETEFSEINKYVQKRSTDRSLINNVKTMLDSSYKRFIIETTKIIIE